METGVIVMLAGMMVSETVADEGWRPGEVTTRLTTTLLCVSTASAEAVATAACLGQGPNLAHAWATASVQFHWYDRVATPSGSKEQPASRTTADAALTARSPPSMQANKPCATSVKDTSALALAGSGPKGSGRISRMSSRTVYVAPGASWASGTCSSRDAVEDVECTDDPAPSSTDHVYRNRPSAAAPSTGRHEDGSAEPTSTSRVPRVARIELGPSMRARGPSPCAVRRTSPVAELNRPRKFVAVTRHCSTAAPRAASSDCVHVATIPVRAPPTSVPFARSVHSMAIVLPPPPVESEPSSVRSSHERISRGAWTRGQGKVAKAVADTTTSELKAYEAEWRATSAPCLRLSLSPTLTVAAPPRLTWKV
mmetsp:Transcript_24725/g.57056  ORF Transcript_24725/g.57056 Transcript_24725/m.57056 type:complete len:368 (+) Transcript_24725:256-1359(+)